MPNYHLHENLKKLFLILKLMIYSEEGADPESIEKVAQQVLAISLPFNRTVIDNIIEQIKANIANLTNVEGVFNHTTEQLAKVRDLLKRAQDAKYARENIVHFGTQKSTYCKLHFVCVILCLCRTKAEEVSDNINKTKEALETTQSVIKTAEKEMTTALENLKNAQNITTLVKLMLLHCFMFLLLSLFFLTNIYY